VNAAVQHHRPPPAPSGRADVRLLCTAQCLRLAGLKRSGISNHALRTAGTLGYLHTGDLRAVQELLGHADPRMTARYVHVVDMAKRNPALFIPVKAA
jgi:integrase